MKMKSHLQSCNVMAVPALSCTCELWTTTMRQESKIQASEMAYLRGVKRCSKFDRIKNKAIWEELQVLNFNEKLEDYEQLCNNT